MIIVKPSQNFDAKFGLNNPHNPHTSFDITMLKRMDLEKKYKVLEVLPIVIMCMLLLSGCKSHVVAPEAMPSKSFGIKKLLILPFKDMSVLYGENASVRCELCGKMFHTGRVEEGAGDILTEHLIALITSRAGFELIPTGYAQGVQSNLLAGKDIEISELNLVIETGRNLGADGVLVGHVYRYAERIGNRLSVDSPAAVCFDVDLIRVADGIVMWSDSFDETQRTLFEDLFGLGKFLQRKGGWVTAEELAISGLEDMVKKLPES